MLKKESKKTNCHSGLDPESSARAHNTKAYHASGCPIGSGMTGESGRSMIEMLGVLAIIGVLSVGGIAGYTSAMNKHRANELLYQASMRATTCAAQIAMGNTPNVDDFGTYDGYTFTASQDTANKKFSITIKDKAISETVCNNIKNALPSDVQMTTPATCASSNASIVLTYADGTGGTAGGSSGGSGGGATSECDPACGAGQECVGGACVTVTPNSSNGCANNSDCNTWCENNSYDKCYCAISSSANWNDSNCYTSFTGTCAEVETKSGITGGYVASNGTMSWWSAVNFCKAAKTGGKLVSLSDLGITGGYQSSAYCEGSDCTGADWSDFKSKLGSRTYWVTDAVSCTDPEDRDGCTSGSNNNSCLAFTLLTDDSFVGNYFRNNDNYYYAMCE